MKDFPGGSDSKASAYNAGDPGSIPELGRSFGEGSTHSSTLAWKIPWMEERGRLQSMGSQRIGHDLTGLACMHAWCVTGRKLVLQPGTKPVCLAMEAQSRNHWTATEVPKASILKCC